METDRKRVLFGNTSVWKKGRQNWREGNAGFNKIATEASIYPSGSSLELGKPFRSSQIEVREPGLCMFTSDGNWRQASS